MEKDRKKAAPTADKTPVGISEAYLENETALRRYIGVFVKADADIDGVCQEAFLRSYESEQKQNNKIRSPAAYLFRVAKNVALKRLGRKSASLTTSIEDLQDHTLLSDKVTVFQQVSSEEQLEILGRAVAQLPERCREAFLLRKVHGRSQKDIAQTLGIAESTVEKHIATGLRRCTQFMKTCTDYFDQESSDNG